MPRTVRAGRCEQAITLLRQSQCKIKRNICESMVTTKLMHQTISRLQCILNSCEILQSKTWRQISYNALCSVDMCKYLMNRNTVDNLLTHITHSAPKSVKFTSLVSLRDKHCERISKMHSGHNLVQNEEK